MRDIIKPALILFVICLAVTVSLAFTYSVTKDVINERGLQEAEEARKEVLSSADSFGKLENAKEIIFGKPGMEIIKDIYKGKQGEKVVGFVVTAEPKGYGGIIKITVGVDADGKLLGIKIGQNNETPGLGTKAAEPAFKSQLSDIKPNEPLKVIKGKKTKPEEVEAISGATITSKAVVEAAQAALDAAAEVMKKEGGVK